MPVSRFSRLAGIPERTYRRRLARHWAGDPSKGPWPAPKVDDIEATAAKYAVGFRHLYNTIRPHQALARTPAQVYTAPGGGPGLVSA